ncbi:MAG: cytochrome ubiquinol oxidase subunit I, partial [Candidatus Adiutrix sp.]
KVPKKIHLASIWLVSFAGILSALWILLANGFMQNPIGFREEGGRLVLDSFRTIITNPYGWSMFFHTVIGVMVLCGFFVMGVSAFNMFRNHHSEFFHKSFKLGLCFALTFSILAALTGHQLGQITAKYQPAKLATMEAQWETRTNAPMYLLIVPPIDGSEENLVEELPIPGLLSFLATGHFSGEASKIIGLKDIPKEDRPPLWPVFISFRLMVGLGTLFVGVAVLTALIRNYIPRLRYTLLLYVLMIPLPYLALQLGWVVTEVGRQPWVVYNIMRTSAAGSPIDWYQVAGSLTVMAAVYTALTIVGFVLMGKAALTAPAKYDEVK